MDCISLQEQFRLYPIIDPETGDEIKIISPAFKKLKYIYGEPYAVKSLKKDKWIRVGKSAYKKLIIEGYNDKDIILKNRFNDKIHAYWCIEQLFITEEIISNVMIYLDKKTFYSFLCTSKRFGKIADNDYFWQLKYHTHHIPFINVDLCYNYYPKMSKIKLLSTIFYDTLQGCSNILLYFIKTDNMDGIKNVMERYSVMDDVQHYMELASFYGYLSIVQYLCKYTCISKNSLIWSAMNGHINVVKYLPQNTQFCGIVYNQALVLASKNGHLDIVQYLVTYGANIHYDSNSAIVSSSVSGHINVVKYLVSRDPSIVLANNSAALRWSLHYNHTDIVKFLIRSD